MQRKIEIISFLILTIWSLIRLSVIGIGELIVLAELLVLACLLAGIAWRLAPQDKFFTFVEQGDIKFVVAGESLVKTIINIPDKVLGDGVKTHQIRQNGTLVDEIMANGVLYDGNPEPKKTFLEKYFGMYWVGIYPFRKIHNFQITKEREQQQVTEDMKPADWIQRDTGPKDVTSLRWKFPRPVLVPDVEFSDVIQGNILVLCKFEILKPIVPIFIQKARFFELLVSYVSSGVINYCRTITFKKFVDEIDKTDGGEMSEAIKNAIRDRVRSELGIELTGLAVSRYDSSQDAIQEALEAEQKEVLLANGVVAKARGDAEADRIRAEARVADVIATAEKLIAQSVEPNIAAQVAGAVGRAQRVSATDSKLTTWVDGSGASVAIPVK